MIITPRQFYEEVGGGGGFDPASISTLVGWWDSDDISTLTLNGTDVTGWTDKTANSNDLTVAFNAPTYQANDPIANSRPSIGSPLVTGRFGLSTSAALTVTHFYIVCYFGDGTTPTFTALNSLMSGDGNLGAFRIAGGGNGANILSSNSAFASTVSKNGALGTTIILPLPLTVCKFVSGIPRSQFYAFGYRQDSNAQGWIGSYSEIIACNGAPTAQEETDLLNYFYNKWGITP